MNALPLERWKRTDPVTFSSWQKSMGAIAPTMTRPKTRLSEVRRPFTGPAAGDRCQRTTAASSRARTWS